MTSPHAPSRCALCAQANALEHGGGPWLVVHANASDGPTVNSLIEQCLAHGVEAVVDTFDSETLPRRNLAYFSGLVVVVPSGAEGMGETLAAASELVARYRAARRRGHPSLVTGSPWFEVGLLQLAGQRGTLRSQKLAQAVPQADFVHYLDEGTVDAFQVLTSHLALVRQAAELERIGITRDSEKAVMRAISAWHIGVRDVHGVFARINEAVELLENRSKYPALNRPLGDQVPKNQLALVLETTGTKYAHLITSREAWGQDSVRAIHIAIDHVRDIFPDFGRPSEREGKRGLQEEFRQLYGLLRTMARYLDVQEAAEFRSSTAPADSRGERSL